MFYEEKKKFFLFYFYFVFFSFDDFLSVRKRCASSPAVGASDYETKHRSTRSSPGKKKKKKSKAATHTTFTTFWESIIYAGM